MKRHNILVLLSLLIIAVGAAVIFIWFRTQKSDVPQTTDSQSNENASLLLATTTVREGHVKAPNYIRPETLLAVSLGTVSKVDATGDINVPAYKGGVTTVTAMMPGKDFGLMDIVVGDEAPELTLETTAQAMVFMAPQLISSDPELSRSIPDVIRSYAAVAALAKDLDRVLRANGDPLKDAAFRTLYGKAVESVLQTLNK